jgi:hypothetical protein
VGNWVGNREQSLRNKGPGRFVSIGAGPRRVGGLKHADVLIQRGWRNARYCARFCYRRGFTRTVPRVAEWLPWIRTVYLTKS